MKTSASGKAKNKPKNFFRYFVDEFIFFRRDFYFELSNPLVFKKKLNALRLEQKAWWRISQSLELKLYKANEAWEFELTAYQVPKRGQPIKTAKAEGKISRKGILQGQLRHVGFKNWFYFAYLLGIPIFIVWLFSQSSANREGDFSSLLTTSFYFSMVVFTIWLRIYLDYKQLCKLIQEAVESAQNEKVHAKI